MPNMDKPLFSIIVPIYQVESYLKECIDSVLTQNFDDYELILVDDGSKDHCGEIIDTYASQYDCIKVIHKINGGLSDARNFGLDIAKGQYIIFLDGDDMLKHNILSSLHHILQDGDYDIITTLCDRKEVTSHSLCNHQVYSGKKFLEYEFKQHTMSMAVWLNVVSNDFIQKHQFRFKKGIYHEDEQFTPRIFIEAQKVYASDLYMIFYRIREDSITMKKDFTKHFMDLYETLKELDKIYDIMEEPLKSLGKESLLEKYLYSYVKAKGYRSCFKYLHHHDFVAGKAISKKNRCKVCLFHISKRLYCLFAKAL